MVVRLIVLEFFVPDDQLRLWELLHRRVKL